MSAAAIEKGAKVRLTIGPLGVVDPEARFVFHDRLVAEEGAAGAYAGKHPNLPDWHLVDVELEDATWQVPVAEGMFEIVS